MPPCLRGGFIIITRGHCSPSRGLRESTSDFARSAPRHAHRSNIAGFRAALADRPVKIIVPFGAGGSGDTLARVVADHLSATFKQQFVVENRTGAAA